MTRSAAGVGNLVAQRSKKTRIETFNPCIGTCRRGIVAQRSKKTRIETLQAPHPSGYTNPRLHKGLRKQGLKRSPSRMW